MGTLGTWLLLSSCLALSLQLASAFSSVADVPATFRDEDRVYVQTLTGKRWYVIESEEHDGRPFFAHLETGETIWEDPRTLPLTEEEMASLSPEMRRMLENNTRSLSGDSMLPEGMVLPNFERLKGKGDLTIAMVAAVPMLLFTGAMVSRIWYLQTYHPGLLFSMSERRKRVRNRQKIKRQKARGKMNQDNKGGRSNNTQ